MNLLEKEIIMAVFTRVNGKTEGFGAFGRTAQLASFSKTNITQAEIDAVVQNIQLTNSITGITTFEAGVTDVVYMLVEGPGISAGSNFGGVTGVTAAVVEMFTVK